MKRAVLIFIIVGLILIINHILYGKGEGCYLKDDPDCDLAWDCGCDPPTIEDCSDNEKRIPVGPVKLCDYRLPYNEKVCKYDKDVICYRTQSCQWNQQILWGYVCEVGPLHPTGHCVKTVVPSVCLPCETASPITKPHYRASYKCVKDKPS
ncbi:MAG: hypothetical protein ACTSV7_12635 [Candidatus Baldrarchaeia archaeon]